MISGRSLKKSMGSKKVRSMAGSTPPGEMPIPTCGIATLELLSTSAIARLRVSSKLYPSPTRALTLAARMLSSGVIAGSPQHLLPMKLHANWGLQPIKRLPPSAEVTSILLPASATAAWIRRVSCRNCMLHLGVRWSLWSATLWLATTTMPTVRHFLTIWQESGGTTTTSNRQPILQLSAGR